MCPWQCAVWGLVVGLAATIVPSNDRDSGKVPVEYLEDADSMALKFANTGYHDFYRMRLFTSPEHVASRGKIGKHYAKTAGMYGAPLRSAEVTSSKAFIASY